MPARPFRIVICDDSAAFATAFKRFLEHDPSIEVQAVFASGETLLAGLGEIEPDLIAMDLEMPGMGGVQAIERLMEKKPTPILVVSSHAGKSSALAAEALGAGALEAVAKSTLGLDAPGDVWATALRSRLKRLASIRLDRLPASERKVPPPGKSRAGLDRPASIVGIGASTGGPPALTQVLAGLPATFPLPLLIVQHITAGFTGGLLSWIDSQVEIAVRFARPGVPATPGAWLAPDDRHLMVDPNLRFVLDAGDHGAAHRPSVDVLFESLAEAAGTRVVAVVLTGMGRDGAKGVRAIRAAGGLAIAQDEASSAVFGMPRAAMDAGADLAMPLAEIGPTLLTLRPGAAKP